MFIPLKAILYFLVFVSFVSLSCEKSLDSSEEIYMLPADTLVNYIIKKGNHYSDQTALLVMNTPAILAQVTFDSSAIYTSIDPVNQADVNKLIGFSDCGTEHQQNSARLGWSWDGNALIIYAYAYINGARVIKTLGPVPLYRTISCSVKASAGHYIFQVSNYLDSIPRHCAGFVGAGYKLYPYFGGDEIAPHEIRIAILEESLKP